MLTSKIAKSARVNGLKMLEIRHCVRCFTLFFSATAASVILAIACNDRENTNSERRGQTTNDGGKDVDGDVGVDNKPLVTPCLNATSAIPLPFNRYPHFDVNEAGNAIVWWRASETKIDDDDYVYDNYAYDMDIILQIAENDTDSIVQIAEYDTDSIVQVALWDGTSFSNARQPDPPFDVAALGGSGTLLVAQKRDSDVELRTYASDCSMTTANFGIPGWSLDLDANANSDAVLAWRTENGFEIEINAVRVSADGFVVGPQRVASADYGHAVEGVSDVSMAFFFASAQAVVGISDVGVALVAFTKPEPVSATEAVLQIEVSTSSDGNFSPAEIILDGVKRSFAITPGGDALLVGRYAPSTLHLARFDPLEGWRILPVYSCKWGICDVQFGIANGGQLVVMTERTLFDSVFATTIDKDEHLEETQISTDRQVLSHALDVKDDGTALLVWLTKTGISAARFAPGNGWSEPKLLYRHELETVISDGDPVSYPNDYPMLVRHLPDGREIVVWMQYDDIVTVTEYDYSYQVISSSSIWSLVIDGDTATAKRLSGSQSENIEGEDDDAGSD